MTTTPDDPPRTSSPVPEPRSQTAQPPRASRKPFQFELHGQKIDDPYAWLREREAPEVLDYLRAENAYTEAVMAHTEELQESLYQEMVGRLRETDQTVPARLDDYFYYSRTEKGKQYSIHCRKAGDLNAPEEILLDLNRSAEGKSYLRLGAFEISPDHRLLAYSLDETGSERYTLRILDLESGDHLPEEITNTSRSVEWAEDGECLYYVTLDAARRPCAAFRHHLGADPTTDPEIFHEKDERFFLSLYKTRSRRFLVLNLGSHTTTEVHYLDEQDPEVGFRRLRERKQDVEIFLDHHGDHLYLLSNENARNFRLSRAPIGRVGDGDWEEVIPHREDEKIDGVHFFRHHLVVSLRTGGLRNLRICDLRTWEWHSLEHDEPVQTVWCGENLMFDTSELRFVYTSLVTPRTVFDYNMETREKVLRKQDDVLGGYDSSRFQTQRLWVEVGEGVQVPVSLVRRRDLPLDGKAPLLLYGYGAYGHSIDPMFSSIRLSLLERGFVYAIAHIRGGGEMGRAWYEAGRLEHKENTFQDFIAVAEHLVQESYTSPDRLVIRGGSAGGLLMGAVFNLRPDLFAAALAEVPFVDVLNTMLDPSLPLTVIEYEEWGNPEQQPWFDRIRGYSPYENVGRHDYPHLLVTAGLNDPRVQYFEPAKWTARLRSRKTDDQRLLFKVAMDSGHGGASGRYDHLREEAFKVAFLLDVLGL